MNVISKLSAGFLLIVFLFLTSCNIEIAGPKELKTKHSLDDEIKTFILQSKGIFTEYYSIYASVSTNYLNGEREEIHAVRFSCYNDNLHKLASAEIDSFSNTLAAIILANVENDTSFNRIIIDMNKTETSIINEKEWYYSKEFEIDSLKNKTLLQ